VRLFACQACGQGLEFENIQCGNCGRALGFVPELTELSALEPDGDAWRARAAPDRPRRYCANAAHAACNWLVEPDEAGPFCRACRHNEIIPRLDDAARLNAWRRLEQAKHRLFYALIRFGLPLATRAEDPAHGLVFRFLDDEPGGARVMTGHDEGVVTIALAEADDAERERRRTGLGEPYRTLLGHFRHESAHHYWDLLVRDGPPETLGRCRALFGDDREDYGEALKRHHARPPSAIWRDEHISAYAAAHPWEDFAETWAHYLHMVDTLETAYAYGLRLAARAAPLEAAVDADPYHAEDFAALVAAFMPLSLALNALNRSMGVPDAYPFVLTDPVIEKLAFVHALVRGRG
jgi:hypothetical protein